MELLSKHLVSDQYVTNLSDDLRHATVCRFMVAYISQDGLASIGVAPLVNVLKHPMSFGVGSLSCSCRYKPLLRLQRRIGDSVRLKYFMEPLVTEPDEPRGITLFHSKIVYLYLEQQQKSVVYIGSHNWTHRALGPKSPRNVEASVRVEHDFQPEDLDGDGTSFASEINRHLIDGYSLGLCLPATSEHEEQFEQWVNKACRSAAGPTLEEATIVLAVRKSADTAPFEAQRWQQLSGKSIYLQALDEDEGFLVLQTRGSLLLLVWDSDDSLAQADQPMILICRISTSNAGSNSRIQGTNQAPTPISGFDAVVFDETQLHARQNSTSRRRASVRLGSGRQLNVFDFEFPTSRNDNNQVDGGVEVEYQFHLEVEHVVFPADGSQVNKSEMLWTRPSFALAETKRSAKLVPSPGYWVSVETEKAMMSCLQRVLQVDPEKAKVLPFSELSELERAKIGKRLADHPLHEAYIDQESKLEPATFYSGAKPGALIAKIDEEPMDDKVNIEYQATLFEVDDADTDLGRTQRVFTLPLEQLKSIWAEAAREQARRS